MERFMTERPKVFGIGFHKTATSSLGDALGQLGYRVRQGFGFESEDIAASIAERAAEVAERYDAFEDNPWPLLYAAMDEKFPGSKFIATWREPEAWFKSVDRHFGKDSTRMREWIYGPGNGAPRGKHDVYVGRYIRHYEEVEEYFRGRPNDYLRLELGSNFNWSTICSFLNVTEPNVPFPKSNVRENDQNWLRQAARQSGVGRAIRKMVNRRRVNWT